MTLQNLLKNMAIVLPLFALAACSSSDTDSSDANTETNQQTVEVIEPATPEIVMTEEEIRNQALRQTQTVFFNFDDITINEEFAAMLGAHAAYLMENPDISLTIEGHADERGTPEYNIALGERRANAVASYLEALGVPSSQISVVSFGEEKPVELGHNDEAYQMNRRAILVY